MEALGVMLEDPALYPDEEMVAAQMEAEMLNWDFDIPANLIVIEHLFSEEDFNWLFPWTSLYYTQLLEVFSRGHSFCGDLPEWSTEAIEDVCARELSFFFIYNLYAEKEPEVCNDLQDELDCYAELPFLHWGLSSFYDEYCME